MAGFFPGHGVMLGLALALVMAPLMPGSAGAEPAHHVVGGDRGWDVASNIPQWSLGKVFKVGDCIWFAYSAGLESIVELGSKEEFDACDLSNPIEMYTDGINDVLLESEGARYFASGRLESCRHGLKLHVAVQPDQEEETAQEPVASPVRGGQDVRGDEGLSTSSRFLRVFVA
ncbi:hypothetical protein Taro_021295 [Colocasia esculenta]|uniref:Phytocyanin domain-containing protein n=1 Tax=Colocasia esculenta TaxID=4460 RepID=A0A843UYM4_COLES|nr:hypothetical protein [Colocasia esculenta]